MWRSIRRGALVTVGLTAALATTALAPANPAGWQVTDAAVLAELPASEVPAFLSSHYGLAPEALSSEPTVVAGWWTGLSDQQRERLVVRMPDVLGNLAGIDYAARDAANRTQLTRELGTAAEQLAARPWDETAAQQLTALQAIEGALNTEENGQRYLVQLTTDQPPLASIAIGDLDTADQVTFAVPGMGTLTSDMQLWTRAAQNIRDAQLAAGASVRSAVVAWMGYRTPPVGVEATRDDYAARGSVLLQRDISGLRSVREEASQPRINVVAHSYGATTAASALAEADLDVTAFVMLGPAGVDTRITDVDALHAEHVYVGEARADAQARWGRVDRRDPRAAAFGATPLAVDGNAKRGLHGVTGHDPIVHSPWNDDPNSPLWGRYADADARERQYQRHMSSFGYLDAGTQSITNVGIVTAAPLDRARADGPDYRAYHYAGNDERDPASAEPLPAHWVSQSDATSSGMPGPNVVDTVPFVM